ncbi:(2E,6E)-farnesyl diphosphate synthase [Sphaerisporangium rufum]|uniref:(2E,6E)-farnesyl diphosphate synthase n=1 Tax=Sphaerisporangium rufum TaxID=1381558 RepID=A0A919R1Y7_9ACTN|nr:polyprenyl synthetase family protein [Sphaerisporangium rufum]GII77558.1 (2E,6E)-farnesyl diphosphate synthase [Sphaerisporangium rufum]
MSIGTPAAPAVPRAVGDARRLLPPALARWTDGLEPALRDMCAYQMGLRDAHGRPTGTAAGKLLRPAFTLLCARAAGGDPAAAVPAAVAVEFTHNASLIHDDIMDGDRERRHRPTVWARYGVPMAVLAGDTLFGLAFEVLTAPDAGLPPDACRHLARTLRHLMAGQCHDLRFAETETPPIDACLAMMEGKTGALLGCACRLGALSADAPAGWDERFHEFGTHLGVAFQLVDDLLGIWGDPLLTGKPVGADLRARKRSAPVVAALSAPGAASGRLARLYAAPGPLDGGALELAAALVEEAGGRAFAAAEARRRIDMAWERLVSLDIPADARAELEQLTAQLADRRW